MKQITHTHDSKTRQGTGHNDPAAQYTHVCRRML